MIIERVPLVVWSFLQNAWKLFYPYNSPAAFLTQTVTLEDQTVVKFEIW